MTRNGVQCIGDGLGELLEPCDEIQVSVQSGAVEPLIYLRDLAAQIGYLDSQGGQALTESLHARLGRRAGHRPSLREGSVGAVNRTGSARAPWFPVRTIRVTGHAGQAERAADRLRRVPGRVGGQDRLVTIPPRGAHPAGLQRAAFPFGEPAPDRRMRSGC